LIILYNVLWTLLRLREPLPLLRHNDIRDLTASVLTKICSQVIDELELQPIGNPGGYSVATSNTQDGARLDVTMNGFWGGQSELMSGSSILMLPLISVPHYLLPTGSMKTSNTVLMANEAGMPCLLLLFVSH